MFHRTQGSPAEASKHLQTDTVQTDGLTDDREVIPYPGDTKKAFPTPYSNPAPQAYLASIQATRAG